MVGPVTLPDVVDPDEPLVQELPSSDLGSYIDKSVAVVDEGKYILKRDCIFRFKNHTTKSSF